MTMVIPIGSVTRFNHCIETHSTPTHDGGKKTLYEVNAYVNDDIVNGYYVEIVGRSGDFLFGSNVYRKKDGAMAVYNA